MVGDGTSASLLQISYSVECETTRESGKLHAARSSEATGKLISIEPKKPALAQDEYPAEVSALSF
jgi:hypothetical protein